MSATILADFERRRQAHALHSWREIPFAPARAHEAPFEEVLGLGTRSALVSGNGAPAAASTRWSASRCSCIKAFIILSPIVGN